MFKAGSIFRVILIIMLVCLTSKLSFAGQSAETIFFISDDLKSATAYKNSRADTTYRKFYMDFASDLNTNDIMYARPKNYTWGNDYYNNKDHKQLAFFETNNYAFLQKFHNVDDMLTAIGENHYKLSVDGGECIGDGCFFDENIISVVFPQKFKVTKKDASVDGSWKIVDNTYSFYSERVKGATAIFELEDTVPQIYVDLAKVLAKFNDIKVTYDGNNVHVVMPVEGVFNSGDAHIQKNGLKWIGVFGETMKKARFKELRVEGHSDNAPIKSVVYPSNWELSAARAATVVRHLVKLGVDPKFLAGVGYADSRPIADNKTADNRGKNRRIEFTIVPELIKITSNLKLQDDKDIDLAPK
jgi:flagellar motor protein MotB